MIRPEFVAQYRDARGADRAGFHVRVVQFDVERLKDFAHFPQCIDGAIVNRVLSPRLHLSPFIGRPAGSSPPDATIINHS